MNKLKCSKWMLLILTLVAPLSTLGMDAGQITEEKAAIGHGGKPVYSPWVNRDFPSRPFFGDTHLHTAYSLDAGTSGTRLDARDAYRFARGEQVTSNIGGNVPPVGSTVDVVNATWTNTIGDSELIAVSEDPDFDPNQAAFYYARVLEIPTPRWTAYDVYRLGSELQPGTRMVQQERAFTSPIWYAPAD
jgi:hypothetical protein